jgi:hypothetical protein
LFGLENVLITLNTAETNLVPSAMKQLQSYSAN